MLTFFNNIQQPCNVTCFPTKSEHYTSFTYRQTEHCKSSWQRQSFSCYSSRKTVCSMNARCHSQWHGVIRTPWDEDLPEIKIFFSLVFIVQVHSQSCPIWGSFSSEGENSELQISSYELWTPWFDRCKYKLNISTENLQRQTIRKRLCIFTESCTVFFFFLLIVLFKEISDYETFRLSVEILKCKICIYIYSPIPPVKKLVAPDSKFSTGTRCHGFFLIL